MLRPAAVLACAACSLLAAAYSSTGQAAIKDTCPNIRELPKEKKVEALLTCIEKLAETVEELSQGLPKDAIVAFPFEKPDDVIPGSEADDPCPPGWKRYRDADGRMIAGVGQHDPSVAQFTPFQSDGERKVLLTVEKMPRHRHELDMDQRHGSPGYLDGGNRPGAIIFGVAHGPAAHQTLRNTGPIVDHPGATESHNNMPPYIALYFCKKN